MGFEHSIRAAEAGNTGACGGWRRAPSRKAEGPGDRHPLAAAAAISAGKVDFSRSWLEWGPLL